jgi:hypothetical protein
MLLELSAYIKDLKGYKIVIDFASLAATQPVNLSDVPARLGLKESRQRVNHGLAPA